MTSSIEGQLTIEEYLAETGVQPLRLGPRSDLTPKPKSDRVPTMDEYLERLRNLLNERATYFQPGHPNSYRRDRFERYDELTAQVRRLLADELSVAG